MTGYSRAVRVAALERLIGQQGPLTPAERRELARLDAELAAVDIDSMNMEQLDAYLLMHAQDPDGKLRRHDELRRRNRTPEEMAEDAALELMLDKMTEAELDDYSAMRSYLAGTRATPDPSTQPPPGPAKGDL